MVWLVMAAQGVWELLAVRALLFLAPLLVSLLLLLRDGPLLLGDRRPPSSWGPDLLASGLLSVVLLLYFMAAAIVTATLLLNQGDVVGEVGFLIGQLEPARFAATLARAGVYGAICAAICLHQARRGAPGAMDMASRMARAFLLGIAILLCLDLLWTIAIDPLHLIQSPIAPPRHQVVRIIIVIARIRSRLHGVISYNVCPLVLVIRDTARKRVISPVRLDAIFDTFTAFVFQLVRIVCRSDPRIVYRHLVGKHDYFAA